MKRVTGITVVEMLVALTVIAIIAVITYALIGRARNATDVATCLSKLSRLNLALQAYRAEYGNADEVRGSPQMLGLPPSLLNMESWRGSNPHEWGQAVWCPRATAGTTREGRTSMIWYAYTPAHLGGRGWQPANELLAGAIPLAFCPYHNSVGHDLTDPTIPHAVNILTIDGDVKSEVVLGMNVYDFDLLTYARLRQGRN